MTRSSKGRRSKSYCPTCRLGGYLVVLVFGRCPSCGWSKPPLTDR